MVESPLTAAAVATVARVVPAEDGTVWARGPVGRPNGREFGGSMAFSLANYERYERVFQKEPGSRTLAECCVLDEWASGVKLLQHLDENSRLELCQVATAKEHMAGRTIASAGKQAERMFVVLSGQVSIMAGSSRGPKCTGTIGPGGTFGEIELLTGERYTTSAIAVSTTISVNIDGETFASTLAPTYGKELLKRARFLQSTTPFR